MSNKTSLNHAVCILADANDGLVCKLARKFAARSIEVTLVDPAVIGKKTFDEINQIYQRSAYLILLLKSENLESSYISHAVQCFEFLKKEKCIIPIFTGKDLTDSEIQKPPIIRKFGERVIENTYFSTSELLEAICFRIQGFSDFLKNEDANESGKTQSLSNNIFPIRNSTLELKHGNILDSTCDVIVSSDDNLLSHGGGVSLAIFDAGGDMLETDAEKHRPASLGDIVVTSAGDLVQKMIFHAITIDLVKDNNGHDLLEKKERMDIHEYVISNVIQRCFLLLSSLRLSSIAFPVIGTGAALFPFQKVLSCMLKTFSKEISRTAQPWKIELWIYRNNGLDVHSIAKNILTQESEKVNLDIPVCTVGQPSEKAKVHAAGEVSAPAPAPQKAASPAATHDIFISYSRQDTEKVRKILAFLDEKRLSYWIDINGIYCGERYKSVIVQSIRQAKIVLFFSSENSNRSDNVIKEISLACGYKKTIIPVKIDSAHYSDDIEYDLGNIDYIDMVNDKEAFKRLYGSIMSNL